MVISATGAIINNPQIDSLRQVLKEKKGIHTLVSVIENTDQELPFEVDEQVPLSLLENWISDDFNSSKTYVFTRRINDEIDCSQILYSDW